MKKYFYCKSYQAFVYAFSMFLKDENIVIITPAADIKKACEYLNVPYISHNNFNINAFIFKKKKVTSEIKKLIDEIGNNEFHFTHTQFAVFCFILVKALSKKKNKIIFYDFEYVYEEVKNPILSKIYFYLVIYRFLINLLYDSKLIIKKINSLFLLGINEDYISNTAEIIENSSSYYEDVFQRLNNYIIPGIKGTSLFISQNHSGSNLIDSKKLDHLVNFVNEQSMLVKLHPNMNEINLFLKCEILPTFIPVELFFNNVKQNIISVDSAALIVASKYGHLKSISLLDMVKNDNDKFVEKFRNDLISKSNGKILFPQNIKELESLIN